VTSAASSQRMHRSEQVTGQGLTSPIPINMLYGILLTSLSSQLLVLVLITKSAGHYLC